jgi:UDP-N-acetylmuramoyl-tripeptide--D-alanyl-D-alanine ligase
MNITAKDIAVAVNGVLSRGALDSLVEGVSTDTRTLKAGAVFFALKGPNFDGHRFVDEAFSKGAAAVVVEAGAGGLRTPSQGAVIEVNDALAALGALASHVRGLYGVPLIAVGGSAGKTTTKEMIASILARSRKVLKTEGNLNNLIGVPLTLFGLDPSREVAVVELGISEPWEMERLVAICRPDIALITNIGAAHMEKLGGADGAARAKAALFTMLRPGGVKAVNLDDERVAALAGGPGETVTYGARKDADVRVVEALGADVAYSVRGESVSVRFRGPSASNAINGAAAIAATVPLGVTRDEISAGLNGMDALHGRMEVVVADGLTLLDDSYNANPASMASALETLARAGGRKVAVIGEMLEMGAYAAEAHREAGLSASMLGIDVVVAVGMWAKDVAGGVARGEARGTTVVSFKDKASAMAALDGILMDGDTVLVKGSRGAALEDVVEWIKRSWKGPVKDRRMGPVQSLSGASKN